MTSQIIHSQGNEPTAGPEATQGRFERIARVDTPAAGQYWRAIKDFDFLEVEPNRDGERPISYRVKAGTVLLVAQIRKNGSEDHTAVVQHHPADGQDSEWALISDFTAHFEYAPDGEQVRAAELAKLQGEIAAIQGQIARASEDESYMNAMVREAIASKPAKEVSGLPANLDDVPTVDVLSAQEPTVALALSSGAVQLASHAIEQVRGAQQLATLQGEWFAGRAKAISNVTKQMTPFLMEKSAVAIARTRSAVDQAKRLMEGVRTMTLFTGEGVKCCRIVDGAPAPAGTPIKLFQAKQYLDECMVYVGEYIDGLNVTEFYNFIEQLKNDRRLQDLIIPADRGVALVACSRQRVEAQGEGLGAAMHAAGVQRANLAGFLLVRDGFSWWLIDSPIEEHERLDRLFPDHDIQGQAFTGINGDEITVSDLRFTKGLDTLHFQAVMFRRFAMILAGRIANGDFFDGVDFMKLFQGSEQQNLFVLVPDASGEGALPHYAESLGDYLKRNRAGVRAGSTVLVDVQRHCSDTTMPSAFHERYDRFDQQYRTTLLYPPPKTLQRALVKADDGNLFISLRLKNKVTDKERDIRCFLATAETGLLTSNSAWLVLDGIQTGDLDRLMAIRDNRAGFRNFIRLFRAARDMATELEEQTAETRATLAQQLLDAQLADPAAAQEIAKNAVLGWRIGSGKDAPTTPEETEALRLLAFRMTNAGAIDPETAATLAREKGLDPLRLALRPDGTAVLHTTHPAADNRLCPQPEVAAFELRFGARKLSLVPQRDALLWKNDHTVTVVHQWPAAEAVTVTKPPLILTPRKRNVMEDIERAFEAGRETFFGPMSETLQQRFAFDFEEAMRELNKTSREVHSPYLSIPIGIATNQDRVEVIGFTARAWSLTFALSEKYAMDVAKAYAKHFRWHQEERRAEVMKAHAAGFAPNQFQLTFCPVSDWVSGRNLWDGTQGRWADGPRIKILVPAKTHWHENQSYWEDLEIKGEDPALHKATRWIARAYRPLEKQKAVMPSRSFSRESVTGVWFVPALAEALARGESPLRALFPKAKDAPSP